MSQPITDVDQAEDTTDLRKAAAKLREAMAKTPHGHIRPTARTCHLRLADWLDAWAGDLERGWAGPESDDAAHAFAQAYLAEPMPNYRAVDPHDMCEPACACRDTPSPCRCHCLAAA